MILRGVWVVLHHDGNADDDSSISRCICMGNYRGVCE